MFNLPWKKSQSILGTLTRCAPIENNGFEPKKQKNLGRVFSGWPKNGENDQKFEIAIFPGFFEIFQKFQNFLENSWKNNGSFNIRFFDICNKSRIYFRFHFCLLFFFILSNFDQFSKLARNAPKKGFQPKIWFKWVIFHIDRLPGAVTAKSIFYWRMIRTFRTESVYDFFNGLGPPKTACDSQKWQNR